MGALSCDLCGLPVIGRPVRARLPAADGTPDERRFCCEGCRRVWELAAASGLSAVLEGPRRRTTQEHKAATAAAAGARRETLRVDGMWCSSCSLVLEQALLGLPGVIDAEVSYAASLARVTFDPAAVDVEGVSERVRLLGYGASRASELGGAVVSEDIQELFLRFFVSAALGMWVLWPTLFLLYPAFARGEFAELGGAESLVGGLALLVLLYGGRPFLVGAWRAAKVRRVTMDTLVVLGTWSAWWYSLVAALTGATGVYFESAAMITTIVLLGRLIEALGRRAATQALASLAAAPQTNVWLFPGAGVGAASEADSAPTEVVANPGDADLKHDLQPTLQYVPLEAVKSGDLIAVRAGERIAVDGTVVRGESAVDQSRLTGEALPARAGQGSIVWAGSINLTDMLVVRVERVGADTLAGRVAALVEDAAFAKSRAQRLADAAAGVFAPIVPVVALAAFAFTLAGGGAPAEGIARAVAVLVVSCPCALGLATPLAAASAMGLASKHGVLVRGAEVLERAGEIRVIALDKTGTLTQARLCVVDTIAAADPERLRLFAAAADSDDPHPIAAALRRSAGVDLPRSERVEHRAGRGVVAQVAGVEVAVGSERLLAEVGVRVPKSAQEEAEAARSRGRTVVWSAAGGELLGGLVLDDSVRVEAVEALAGVRALGVEPVMISGDASATCHAVAAALGISEVHAEMLPHDKEYVVRRLAERGAVAFVGDGINDAPALAAASLAVALGGGSDVAMEAGDVVLLGEDGGAPARPLAALPLLLRLARRSRRVIRANLVWAFTYNAIAIPLAATGRLSPMVAAAAMALSSLAVVATSARLRVG
ncbi:MAG: heavy metal translocating P-type ATPase [Thermoleophilia bacterium]